MAASLPIGEEGCQVVEEVLADSIDKATTTDPAAAAIRCTSNGETGELNGSEGARNATEGSSDNATEGSSNAISPIIDSHGEILPPGINQPSTSIIRPPRTSTSTSTSTLGPPGLQLQPSDPPELLPQSSSEVPPADPKTAPEDLQKSSPPQGPSPILTWADRVRQAQSPEAKLRILLHQPMPEAKKAKGILKTTVRLQLSKKALERPYFAWKVVLKAFTGVQPLLISMYHPGLADVFWDVKHQEKVEKELLARKVLVEPPPPTEKDVPRLTRCYLKGYFSMLRRSQLQVLPTPLRDEVFLKAEEIAQSLPGQDRRHWLKLIAADRESMAILPPIESKALQLVLG